MIDGLQSIWGNNSSTSMFREVFASTDDFITDFRASDLNVSTLTDDTLKIIFAELYARYGDSYFKSTNNDRNKYMVFSILYNKGLIYQKKVEVQNALLALELTDLKDGGVTIYNDASNPGNEATTYEQEDYSGEDFLKYVDSQNVTKNKKGVVEAYKAQLYALKDVTTGFIQEFSKLFESMLWSSYLPIFVMEA